MIHTNEDKDEFLVCCKEFFENFINESGKEISLEKKKCYWNSFLKRYYGKEITTKEQAESYLSNLVLLDTKTIADIKMNTRNLNALLSYGISLLPELLKLTKEQLRWIRNIGKDGSDRIIAELRKNDLSLKEEKSKK